MTIKMKGAAALVAALAIVGNGRRRRGAKRLSGPQRQMLVGYPPGGPVDIIGRVVSDRLSQIWGKPVVVENITGASGNIAADRAAQATPDGYTLLVSTNAQLVVNPSLYKMTFDPAKDLTPISLAVYSPNILVIPNDVPAKNVKELVAYLKATSGQELRLRRRRHHAAPCRRAVQVDGACRHPARALSRRRASDHRPAGRARHHVLRRHLVADSAGARRQAARARRHIGETLSGDARAADHDRSGLSRVSCRCSRWAWWRRPERRPRSSRRFTRTWSKAWPRRTCAKS